MREIKFKGRSKEIGWVYGQLAYDINGNTYIIQEVELDSSYGLEETILFATMWYRVDKETVGQYTRLKDKNGKEIYEGDILEYAGGGIYVVVFDEMIIMCPQDKIEMPSPGYYGILIGDKAKELCPLGITQRLARVIGNIYDNPELLEKGE